MSGKMRFDTFRNFRNIPSSVHPCKHQLFAKHFLWHFSALPDPWPPADPLPPGCSRPWRVEVEPLLVLNRPLEPPGVPGDHTGPLQDALVTMLGAQTLVMVGVPSSHSDIAGEHFVENFQETLVKGTLEPPLGSLTAAEEPCAPRRAVAQSCTTSGAPLMVTFAPSGRGLVQPARHLPRSPACSPLMMAPEEAPAPSNPGTAAGKAPAAGDRSNASANCQSP